MKKITISLLIAVTHQAALHTMHQVSAQTQSWLLLDWKGKKEELQDAMKDAAQSIQPYPPIDGNQTTLLLNKDTGCVTITEKKLPRDSVTLSYHYFINSLEDLEPKQANQNQNNPIETKRNSSIIGLCAIS